MISKFKICLTSHLPLLALILASCGSVCDPTGLSLESPINDFSGLTSDNSGTFLIPVPYGVKDRDHLELGHGGIDFGSEESTSVVSPATGTVIDVVSTDVGTAVQIDLGRGNCGVRLNHLSEVTVAEGQVVNIGDPIGKFSLSPFGTYYLFHYELSGISGVSSNSDSNTKGSLCPLLYSSEQTQKTFTDLLSEASSDVKLSWSRRPNDALLNALGNSSSPAGYCYPLGTDVAVEPTFP